MVKLNKIYTKTGDKGTTGLADGTRVSKHDLRVEAYGTVDEANAALGIAALYAESPFDQMIARIQNDLFDLGADLATPLKDTPSLRISTAQVKRLEDEIDLMNKDLKPLNSFILPGGCALAAHLHLARTITRRAERLIVALGEVEKLSDYALPYTNRLSDHLFVMARFANDHEAGDVLWVPGENRVS